MNSTMLSTVLRTLEFQRKMLRRVNLKEKKMIKRTMVALIVNLVLII
jgi:hypothetical protein